jgi:hypothetical protein
MLNRREMILDLLMFASTITVASWRCWEAKDIIWGLWISRLILGYSFIIVSALSIYRHGSITGTAKGTGRIPSVTGAVKRLQPLMMNVFVAFFFFVLLGPRSGAAWLVVLACLGFSIVSLLLGGSSTREDGS